MTNVQGESRRASVKTDFDAVIIGAGFSGMYMLHSLRDKLDLNVTVFEAGDGVGGTWYWNRYPGARCDSDSYIYCYTFDKNLLQEWNWSERYPEQGDVVRARFVIAAVGALSAANIPPFKGLESFKGKCYHTSQWPHDGVDFTAKRVGVIGTGATGVQAIPEIAQQAKHLTVFQRTPTFCVPARNGRVDPEVTTARKADYDGIRQRIKNSFFGFELNFILKSVLDTTPEEREQEFDRMWDVGGFPFWLANYQDMFFSKEANDVIADYLKRKIRATVNDPVVAEKLTPKTYPYGTKRQPLDTNYLETFNKKNVVLVDASTDGPIEEITPNGIRAGGKEYPLDIIVVATGFDALTGSLKQLGIKGRGGTALAQEWEEGPPTYLGLALTDYPNLFTITGPQSPSELSNVPVSIDQHVEWITECIAHMRRNKLATIDATPQAQDAWGTHVSEVVNGTLLPGTNSWYMGANIAGKARRFLPYLGPEGVGGYRRKRAEVAAKGYEGFGFASEGRGGTGRTTAARSTLPAPTRGGR